MTYSISYFRGDNLDKNLRKDPNHPLRCEMCWKPLYDNIKHIVVTCQDDLTFPNTEAEVLSDSPTIPVGPRCFRDLIKEAKENGFIIKAIG